MLAINLKSIPDKGLFDITPIGHNLTRDKVVEITSTWSQAQFLRMREQGYGHYLTETKDAPKDTPPTLKEEKTK